MLGGCARGVGVGAHCSGHHTVLAVMALRASIPTGSALCGWGMEWGAAVRLAARPYMHSLRQLAGGMPMRVAVLCVSVR